MQDKHDGVESPVLRPVMYCSTVSKQPCKYCGGASLTEWSSSQNILLEQLIGGCRRTIQVKWRISGHHDHETELHRSGVFAPECHLFSEFLRRLDSHLLKVDDAAGHFEAPEYLLPSFIPIDLSLHPYLSLYLSLSLSGSLCLSFSPSPSPVSSVIPPHLRLLL